VEYPEVLTEQAIPIAVIKFRSFSARIVELFIQEDAKEASTVGGGRGGSVTGDYDS
jgi:hypothetical protein